MIAWCLVVFLATAPRPPQASRDSSLAQAGQTTGTRATLPSSPAELSHDEERFPQALEHAVRAELELLRGDLGGAERETRYALIFDHGSARLRALLARVLWLRGDSEGARIEFQKALIAQSRPASPDQVERGLRALAASDATSAFQAPAQRPRATTWSLRR